jgi:hypothetical protein
MEELIKQAFLHIDVIGPHVQEGHYDLIGPNGEIILPSVWDRSVQPDWSITMHMWPVEKMPLRHHHPGMVPQHHMPPRPGQPGMPGPHGPMPYAPRNHLRPQVPVPPPSGFSGRPCGQGIPPRGQPAARVVTAVPQEERREKEKKKNGPAILGFFAGGKPKSSRR